MPALFIRPSKRSPTPKPPCRSSRDAGRVGDVELHGGGGATSLLYPANRFISSCRVHVGADLEAEFVTQHRSLSNEVVRHRTRRGAESARVCALVLLGGSTAEEQHEKTEDDDERSDEEGVPPRVGVRVLDKSLGR